MFCTFIHSNFTLVSSSSNCEVHVTITLQFSRLPDTRARDFMRNKNPTTTSAVMMMMCLYAVDWWPAPTWQWRQFVSATAPATCVSSRTRRVRQRRLSSSTSYSVRIILSHLPISYSLTYFKTSFRPGLYEGRRWRKPDPLVHCRERYPLITLFS